MTETAYTESRAKRLKDRTSRCVCKYCGGQLELRRIIFSDYEEARIEIFCTQCDRIEYGVEPEIYRAARYFTEEMDFNCYPDLDDNDSTRRMTIAKVCEILTWGVLQMGFLEEDGFIYPPKADQLTAGEALLVSQSQLAQFDEGGQPS